MSELDDLDELAGFTGPLIETIKDRKNKNRIINGVKERRCYMCKEWKPMQMFSLSKSIGPNGYNKVYLAHCKPCASDYAKRKSK